MNQHLLHRRTGILTALIILLSLVALPFGVVQAQDTEPELRPQRMPGPFEASARLRTLVNDADDAIGEARALGDVSEFDAEETTMRERLDNLRAHVVAVTEAEYMRPERLSRIRDHALQHEQRLDALRQQADTRLDQLETLRSEWTERREFWTDWQDSLRATQRLSAVRTDFREAFDVIGRVEAAIEAALPEPLQLRETAIELRDEAARSAEYVASVRAGRRQALTERGEPVLFTPAHLTGISPENLRQWAPLDALAGSLQRAFLAANAGLMLLHLVLVLGVAFLARNLRRKSIPEGAWSGLLLRPRAVALFGVTALLADRYVFSPALWDVLIWAVLAGSGAVLAGRLVRVPSLRRLVFVIAAFYPSFLLVEAMLLPAALFRLVLGGAAAMGVLYFGALWRSEVKDRDTSWWVSGILALAAVVSLVVLVAEVFGFYLLARWVLHATITSAYVVFLVIFVLVMARGAISTLVRIQSSGKLGIFRTIGAPFVERLLVVLQIVLVVVAGLQILDIWELALSPAETWARITSIGFTVAGAEITIGRILLAGILVYIAILASWMIRGFARTEVFPRWELERGVGDSISALLHYVVITIGVFIGLGALGVELQNFAIVAGALGVGIGFGLQNIVNNFVSGLILLFERPVRPGDTVVVGTELGTIKKIGLRSTTVMTFDRAEVIVPNGDLVSEKVTNWTLTDPVARLILPVGVAYGTDVHLVLRLLREAAERHSDVLQDPVPQTLFMGFGDSALDFELRVWVQELALRLKVRSEILADIDRLFREHDIEIPFPQRDLHVRSFDPRILADAIEAQKKAADGSDGSKGEPLV